MAMRDIPRAKHLVTLAVLAEPRNYDFGYGLGEHWDFWEAARCSHCGNAVVAPAGETECEDCGEGYLLAEGPMMNHFYPLPHFHGDEIEAARLLVDLPLALVRLDETDEYGLALTGGGMDLSWEICEGYCRLGYLPPLRIADSLPNLADSRLDERHKRILAACNRSVSIVQIRAEFARRSLANNRDYLRRNGGRGRRR